MYYITDKAGQRLRGTRDNPKVISLQKTLLLQVVQYSSLHHKSIFWPGPIFFFLSLFKILLRNQLLFKIFPISLR